MFKATRQAFTEYKVLKSLWRLFHKANPDAQKSRYLFGLNEYSTEQNAIDIGTDTFPAFKTAYETYIDLHDALMGRHADELKNIITNYQPNGTPLDTAMHTLRKNLNGVINAAKSSYSNGPIEASTVRSRSSNVLVMASPIRPICSHASTS